MSVSTPKVVSEEDRKRFLTLAHHIEGAIREAKELRERFQPEGQILFFKLHMLELLLGLDRAKQFAREVSPCFNVFPDKHDT